MSCHRYFHLTSDLGGLVFVNGRQGGGGADDGINVLGSEGLRPEHAKFVPLIQEQPGFVGGDTTVF